MRWEIPEDLPAAPNDRKESAAMDHLTAPHAWPDYGEAKRRKRLTKISEKAKVRHHLLIIFDTLCHVYDMFLSGVGVNRVRIWIPMIPVTQRYWKFFVVRKPPNKRAKCFDLSSSNLNSILSHPNYVTVEPFLLFNTTTLTLALLHRCTTSTAEDSESS
jgi:hypothetical protein